MRIAWLVAFALFTALFSGCGSLATLETPQPEEVRSDWDERMRLTFERAILLKPNPKGFPDSSDDSPATAAGLLTADAAPTMMDFAPLLLIDQPNSSVPSPAVPSVQTVIFAARGQIAVHHRRVWQLTYWWNARSFVEPNLERWVGIKITLNSAGHPALWEVLGENRRVFFVARSLEQASLAEFGSALPGRRYAVEQPLKAQPAMVVVGVLEDGPVPMGPVVYVQPVLGRISAVLCRCMAAHVRIVIETGEYELQSLNDDDSNGTAPTGAGEGGSAVALESCFRLPDSF